MGALCSSDHVVFEVREGVDGQDDLAFVILRKHLELNSHELDKFYAIFLKIENIESSVREKNRQHIIHQKKLQLGDEFDEASIPAHNPHPDEIFKDTIYEFYDIPKTVINRQVFGFFEDKDYTGRITFMAFVASLWNFLSFNTKWLSHFLFALFNEKQRHYLSHNQLISLVTTILDHVAEPPTIRKLVTNISRLPVEITHSVFDSYISNNPIVFEPILLVHGKLRTKCLGLKYWMKKQKMRLKNRDQMCTDYLIKLNEINLDLHLKKAMAAEVEERMSEWKQNRDKLRLENNESNNMNSSFQGPPVDANIPPPSLLFYVVPTPNDTNNKKKREKKKRKRHSRKTRADQEKMGPYGGPAEWLGRGELPELHIPPNVLAALEEKNAQKEILRTKRKELRAHGKSARVAAELIDADRNDDETEIIKPRLKYLPSVKGMPRSKSSSKAFGLQSNWVSYVDNL